MSDKNHGYEMDVGDDPDAIVNREKSDEQKPKGPKVLWHYVNIGSFSEEMPEYGQGLCYIAKSDYDALKLELEPSKPIYSRRKLEAEVVALKTENEKLRAELSHTIAAAKIHASEHDKALAELMAAREPLKLHVNKGHNDTCSFALTGRHECDCGNQLAREALTRIDNFLNGGGEK